MSDVETTIKKPEVIFRQGNARVFYGKIRPDDFGNQYLLVAAKLQSDMNGFVASAYPVMNIPKPGEIEWKKA